MSGYFTSSRNSSRGRLGSPEYETDLLPKVNGGSPGSSRNHIWLSRRYSKLVIATLIAFALFYSVVTLGSRWRLELHRVPSGGGLSVTSLPDADDDRLPPDWARFREYELQTSEQHGDYPDTKYFFSANHARNCGWGNVFQEMIMNALLAYRMNRTFVYYNYTWRDDGTQFTRFNDKWIPSTIPLTALVAGPMTGAPSSTDRSAPRPFAITEDYFHRVCPESERRKLRTEDVMALLGATATAGNMIDKWVAVYGDAPEKCIEIPSNSYQTFDIFIFGDGSRLLDAWSSLFKSPILQEFAWSPLVELAFDQNREVFAPTTAYVPPLGSIPMAPPPPGFVSPSAARYAPIAGLLALHIRRGDFQEHCANLARWGSGFEGFNDFAEMPDKFHYPQDTDDDTRIALQRPHCFPSIDEIVQRAVAERAAQHAQGHAPLTDVYIMTNGADEWVAELKAKLIASGGWRSIASSRDLQVNWEQKFVKQAVDMLIGQRAQVFVGNAYSSLSGLVNMFRMANGIPASQNRVL